jgi:hypothetical protein
MQRYWTQAHDPASNISIKNTLNKCSKSAILFIPVMLGNLSIILETLVVFIATISIYIYNRCGIPMVLFIAVITGTVEHYCSI